MDKEKTIIFNNLTINMLSEISEADKKECAELMAGTEPWVTLKRSYDEVMNILRDEDLEKRIYKRGQEFIGFALLSFKGPFRGYIKSIVLKKAWRSKGVGRSILQSLASEIFESYPNVFLCVSSFNPRAKALYEQLGYEEIGELKDYMIKGHSEFIMRKTTGPINDFKKKSF